MKRYSVTAGIHVVNEVIMDFGIIENKKPFLLCVDSDGCAMNTMESKHRLCFGPLMISEWGLQAWQKEVLNLWNDVNLYSITRGTNRFLALAKVLAQVDEQYCPIHGVETLTHWVQTAEALSNDNLEMTLHKMLGADREALQKALHWSKSVNVAVDALPNEQKQPFAGVEQALSAAHAVANVVVVSSANREAVKEEWQRCNLLCHTDMLLTQDVGSKAYCLSMLRKSGYEEQKILMVGDAPGDRQAAEKAGVLFYPILVKHEAESWQEFTTKVLPLWLNGQYSEAERLYVKRFLQNLGVSET